jgi:hypothetical protein
MPDFDKRSWWKALDPTWKRLFKLTLDINHTPSDEELMAIFKLEAIDCSNSRIISVDPLQHLTQLRKLNCSNTRLRSIEKLRPLRLLDELDISRTDITSLEPLRECEYLWRLNCSQTKVDSLTGLEGLSELAYVDCLETSVSTLAPLVGILKLRKVNCHLSKVAEPDAVRKLTDAGVEVVYTATPLMHAELERERQAEEDEFDIVDRDSMFEEAAQLIVVHQEGSTSLIQRKLKLGYNRAGRLIDQLERAGILGPFEGSKAREVLIRDEYSLEQLLAALPGNEKRRARPIVAPILPILAPPVLDSVPPFSDQLASRKKEVEKVISSPPSRNTNPLSVVNEFDNPIPPTTYSLPEEISSGDASPQKKNLWTKLGDAIKLITG